MTVLEQHGNAGYAPGPETVIRPRGRWRLLNIRELWAARELLLFLVWRDVKVRYKQTLLGIAWTVIQPLIMMVVFTVIFQRLAGLPSGGPPYAVVTFSGLLPWLLFSSSLTKIGISMVSNSSLITKVYFPRLLIPLAASGGTLVDFLISCVVLAGLMAYYNLVPGVEVLVLPAFLLLAIVTSVGAGLWLASLNVRYRDIGLMIPFLVQVLMFVTPVGYSSAAVPEKWRVLYDLNPLATVINGFRWTLLGTEAPSAGSVAFATLVAGGLLVTGVAYFRGMERTFADEV